MRILLLGSGGQLGRALVRTLSVSGGVRVIAYERAHLDITNEAKLATAFALVRPNVVVNAAAYTAVDAAERDAAKAFAVNAYAPGVIGALAKQNDALMLHFSTDYVFRGDGSLPYKEDDPTEPLSVYGQSKLAGEKAIRESCDKYLIARIGWLYGSGRDFFGAILQRALAEKPLDVVDNQWGTPSAVDDVALWCAAALKKVSVDHSLLGTYHVAAQGYTSRYDSAVTALAMAERLYPDKAEILSRMRKTMRRRTLSGGYRPLNCRLNTNKGVERLGLRLPPWQDGVYKTLPLLIQTIKNEAILAKRR